MENSSAVFMDLDGTLYDGYIWLGLTRHHLQHRIKLIELARYLGLHLPLWPLLKLKLISPDTFYQSWGIHMAWLIRGISVERAQKIWTWLIDKEILPNLRPEMTAAIRRHKAKNHLVFLLSGTFQPLLLALADRLGVDGAIATPLVVENGEYLGKIHAPLNVGQGKVKRIEDFLQDVERQIDLAQSYLYTDSIVDLPVLRIVGFPVAVYPDRSLAKVAQSRSWKIIPSED
jgi:HAD superfamily hydrolase (TIGR01490 family)